MWSVVAVGARPILPSPDRASVPLQGFSLLYTHCWAALPEHRPTMDLVLKWVEALKDASTTKPLESLRNRKTSLLRIYTGAMLPEMEYKTVRVLPSTTALHLVTKLLDSFNLRHIDPHMFSVQLELGTDFNLLTLAPENTLFSLLTCLPWVCKPYKARLQARPGGLLQVYCSCALQACGVTSIKVALDSKVEQVLEVVMKARREEKEVDESLVEVDPDGRRRFLDPEEKPLEVMQAWPSSGWKFEVDRNLEEETHLWWRKRSLHYGCGGINGH